MHYLLFLYFIIIVILFYYNYFIIIIVYLHYSLHVFLCNDYYKHKIISYRYSALL